MATQMGKIPDPPYTIHYLGLVYIPPEDSTPVRVLSEASTLPTKSAAAKTGGGLFSSLNSVAFGAADFLSGGSMTQNIENLKMVLVNEVTKKSLKDAGQTQTSKFTTMTDDYVFYLYTPNKTLGAVMVCPNDPAKNQFPADYAHGALMEIYSRFVSKFKGQMVSQLTAESCVGFQPVMSKFIEDLKSGTETMQIWNNLGETKDQVGKMIKTLTLREEVMDKLVEKSSHLNEQTKMFYDISKKQNSCCVVM